MARFRLGIFQFTWSMSWIFWSWLKRRIYTNMLRVANEQNPNHTNETRMNHICNITGEAQFVSSDNNWHELCLKLLTGIHPVWSITYRSQKSVAETVKSMKKKAEDLAGTTMKSEWIILHHKTSSLFSCDNSILQSKYFQYGFACFQIVLILSSVFTFFFFCFLALLVT